MSRRSTLFRASVIALVPTLGAVPAAARAGGIWHAGEDLLIQGNDGLRLRSGDSESVLALPDEARIESVVALADRALLLGFVGPHPQLGGSGELYLALAEASGPRPLAPPPGRRPGEARESPAALVAANGELAGLAWLEGESRQRNAVYFAEFRGGSFSEPREVAPAGPGSQAALQATRLDDGTSLLLWARFDGSDDEIVAARFEDGHWSAPVAIAPDNGVPDIVPAVVAIPGGALAAWSRYDGHDYRVVIARFERGAWSAPVVIGEAGSLFPTLERAGGGARLIYANARPQGWSVVEIAGDGRELRRAAVETAERERPVAAGDRFLWSTGERALAWRGAAPPSHP